MPSIHPSKWHHIGIRLIGAIILRPILQPNVFLLPNVRTIIFLLLTKLKLCRSSTFSMLSLAQDYYIQLLNYVTKPTRKTQTSTYLICTNHLPSYFCFTMLIIRRKNGWMNRMLLILFVSFRFLPLIWCWC